MVKFTTFCIIHLKCHKVLDWDEALCTDLKCSFFLSGTAS